MKYKIIYILNSGSPLIKEAVNSLDDDNVRIVNPFGKNRYTALLRKVLIRTIPSMCFFVEHRALKQVGYRNEENEHVVVFDSPYWFKLLPSFKKNINKAKLSIWFWNSVKSNDQVELMKSLKLKVSTFDNGDAERNNWGFHPQFFWQEIDETTAPPNWDVFYIGREKAASNLKRGSLLLSALDEIESSNSSSRVVIVGEQSQSLTNTVNRKVEYLNHNIPYEEILHSVLDANAVLELNAAGQSGLTLRALESLFCRRKLITNNSLVRQLTFYSKSNIYILGEKDRSVKEFLKEPIEKFSNEVKFEFTFKSWVSFMRNLD